MSGETASILKEAMKLSPEERLEIADSLVFSVFEDGPADADVERAWAAEVRRRVAEVDAGAAKLTSWEEVQDRMERRRIG